MIRISIILSACFVLLSCSKEVSIPAVADFEIEIVNSDYSVPVRIAITNRSLDADDYLWTFEGADPTTSTNKNPGTITYLAAGNYVITLQVSNQDGSHDSMEVSVPIDEAIVVGFETEIVTDNFPPVEVALTNLTTGADTYLWTFEGGDISSSDLQDPATVTFVDPGQHIITLEVSNGLETYQYSDTITVASHLVASFGYEVDFVDDDWQAPVTLQMLNTSISATDYLWTFASGSPISSTDPNPTVTFNSPGSYTLLLQSTNGKATETSSHTITVVTNTNIRSFENIRLGINTAHNANTQGAFFSTTTRESYSKNQVSDENGSLIDLAFFGLNQNMGFNKFVSPDQVQTLTFAAIPNATHTQFINVQESCKCTAAMTVAEFDGMTEDSPLAALSIEETPEGLQDFDHTTVPRIVLFKTHDGRKGAIKIKDYVIDGGNSYIVLDIKVQKEAS